VVWEKNRVARGGRSGVDHELEKKKTDRDFEDGKVKAGDASVVMKMVADEMVVDEFVNFNVVTKWW
jgi:hypothetical protein